MKELGKDKSVRAIVLTGEGRYAFSELQILCLTSYEELSQLEEIWTF
jgi:hypothetical protein